MANHRSARGWRSGAGLALVAAVLVLATGVRAEEASAPGPEAGSIPPAKLSQLKKMVDRGLDFLREEWDRANLGEDPEGDGAWGHPGISALALVAFFRSHRHYTIEDGPFLSQPFQQLLDIQRESGAINNTRENDNYITAVALMALVESGESSAEVRGAIERASTFLRGSQLDEGEGYSPDDKMYGGSGYGSSQRADMSNTQLTMEALVRAGMNPDDPYVKKALAFLSRCQNLSETNDLESFRGEKPDEVYVPGNDGGFMYFPGGSPAGTVAGADGALSLRSYGSMTYAGFKSMIHAGLTPEDPRVRAALEWIRKNFRLDENPNVGQQGLYYYYHTFARALAVAGEDGITDAEGVKHNWRVELIDALAARQQADGSWVNENDRWWEGNPVLATIYAVLALEQCYPDR